MIQIHVHSVAPALDSQMPGGDHAGSIVALLYLPIVVMGLLLALEAGARAGIRAAIARRIAPPVTLQRAGRMKGADTHVAVAGAI